MGIVDVMDKVTRKLWEEKKASLAQGNEALASQLDEGKDLLSVLRKSTFVYQAESIARIIS